MNYMNLHKARMTLEQACGLRTFLLSLGIDAAAVGGETEHGQPSDNWCVTPIHGQEGIWEYPAEAITELAGAMFPMGKRKTWLKLVESRGGDSGAALSCLFELGLNLLRAAELALEPVEPDSSAKDSHLAQLATGVPPGPINFDDLPF